MSSQSYNQKVSLEIHIIILLVLPFLQHFCLKKMEASSAYKLDKATARKQCNFFFHLFAQNWDKIAPFSLQALPVPGMICVGIRFSGSWDWPFAHFSHEKTSSSPISSVSGIKKKKTTQIYLNKYIKRLELELQQVLFPQVIKLPNSFSLYL